MNWSGVDYLWIMFLIGCLDTHSDGTHSLQRILWWASDEMLLMKSVQMKEQIHLHLGWPEGEFIFTKLSFWWTLPLKMSWNPSVQFHCILSIVADALTPFPGHRFYRLTVCNFGLEKLCLLSHTLDTACWNNRDWRQCAHTWMSQVFSSPLPTQQKLTNLKRFSFNIRESVRSASDNEQYSLDATRTDLSLRDVPWGMCSGLSGG